MSRTGVRVVVGVILTAFIGISSLSVVGYAQARASTTTGVITIRQILSGALSFASGAYISLNGPTVRSGTGSPEGVVTAPISSLYLRTDGGVGTAVYRKESGSGTTGWAALADTVVDAVRTWTTAQTFLAANLLRTQNIQFYDSGGFLSPATITGCDVDVDNLPGAGGSQTRDCIKFWKNENYSGHNLMQWRFASGWTTGGGTSPTPYTYLKLSVNASDGQIRIEGRRIDANAAMPFLVLDSGYTKPLLLGTDGTDWIKLDATSQTLAYDQWPLTARQLYKPSVGGILWSSTPSTGNGNVGAGEDTILTQTIAVTTSAYLGATPVAGLTADQQAFVIQAAGTLANTVNNKRIRAHAVEGANDTTICDSGTLASTAAGSWTLLATVRRVSSTTFNSSCIISMSDGTLVTTIPKVVTAATYTFANSGTITVTGEATSNNDVVATMFDGVWEP